MIVIFYDDKKMFAHFDVPIEISCVKLAFNGFADFKN